MNILITGATGFIGRHLVEELSKQNHHITCLIRNPKKAKTILESFGVSLVYADITDSSALERLELGPIDVLFHCAGFVSNKNKKLLFLNNVQATKNMCDLALKLKIKKMIYVSSVAVVSGHFQTPLTEDLPYKTNNLYAESKAEAEKIVIDYRANKDLNIAIIRPCMVYGKDEPHALNLFLKLIKGHLLPLFYQGQNKYHLVYVKNVSHAMIFMMNHDACFTKGTFFIADKEVLTFKEVCTIFAKALGTRPPWSCPNWITSLLKFLPGIGPKISFITKDRVYSTQALENLGFKHAYEARTALKDCVKL